MKKAGTQDILPNFAAAIAMGVISIRHQFGTEGTYLQLTFNVVTFNMVKVINRTIFLLGTMYGTVVLKHL